MVETQSLEASHTFNFAQTRVTVTIQGTVLARRALSAVTVVAGAFYDSEYENEISLGDIPAGQTRDFTTEVSFERRPFLNSYNYYARLAYESIDFGEAQGETSVAATQLKFGAGADGGLDSTTDVDVIRID